MQQGNIKIYRDGKDLYIKICNCEESIEKVLTSMVGTTVTKATKNISATPEIRDEPVKETEAKEVHKEHKFTYGPYKGMTPKEIHLKIGAKKAFCYFVTEFKKIYDTALKSDVDIYIKYHKGFLNKRLLAEQVKYDTKMVFFTEYQPLIKDKMDKILNDNGYTTIADYLNMESEEVTTKLYKEYVSLLLKM